MLSRTPMVLIVVSMLVSGCAAGSGKSRPAADAGADPGSGVGPDAGVGPDTGVGPDAGSDPGGGPATGTLRVYVAGESIEAFNRFDKPPFLPDGSLNAPDDNSRDEYGWMVPLADRLALRAPKLKIEWVGASPWIDHEYNSSIGTYPPGGPGDTSAIAGTTIETWLAERRSELKDQDYCFDVAFATRGGNDMDVEPPVPEAEYKKLLRELVLLLDGGSSCREHPVIYVTSHMPDGNGWNWESDPASITAWIDAMRLRYVTWTRAVVDDLRKSKPEVRVYFVDMFTPFLEESPTTAFPSPQWLKDGGPDLDKIHRDSAHPRRLASIYAGEVVADALDLGVLTQ